MAKKDNMPMILATRANISQVGNMCTQSTLTMGVVSEHIRSIWRKVARLSRRTRVLSMSGFLRTSHMTKAGLTFKNLCAVCMNTGVRSQTQALKDRELPTK